MSEASKHICMRRVVRTSILCVNYNLAVKRFSRTIGATIQDVSALSLSLITKNLF